MPSGIAKIIITVAIGLAIILAIVYYARANFTQDTMILNLNTATRNNLIAKRDQSTRVMPFTYELNQAEFENSLITQLSQKGELKFDYLFSVQDLKAVRVTLLTYDKTIYSTLIIDNAEN